MYKYSGCFAMWSLFIDSILYMLNPPPPPIAFRGAWGWCGGCGIVVRWSGKNEKSPRENGAFGIRGRVLSVKESWVTGYGHPHRQCWSCCGFVYRRYLETHLCGFPAIEYFLKKSVIKAPASWRWSNAALNEHGCRGKTWAAAGVFNCFNCIVLTYDFWLITRIARCYCLCICSKNFKNLYFQHTLLLQD